MPLRRTGAPLPLRLAGGMLDDVHTEIGLVTQVGLTIKHDIPIVESCSPLHEKGLAIRKAAIEAATLRLCLMLMSTGARVPGAIRLRLVAGAVPRALSRSAG